tara:strand:+ start:2411 stop:3541 length:1131 start_codon:yes stop_codon:yes gene_type:complete
MRKKIAIIGSGIAGLTFANLIKTNPDFEFVIYEKEAVFNLNEGFGIQLSVNSISILNKIGFKQLNKSEKYNPTKLDFYSINLNKICDLDLAQFNSADTEYTTLKRSVLIKFLKEKLLSNSIIFRKEIRNINQLNEKININFIDGSSDNVDYLIVSDGVFSNTKSAIEKKIFKPKYSGAIAIRANLIDQNILNFNLNNISLIMGSNFHFVLYPTNQKKEINLVCVIRKKIENSNPIIPILENSIFKENKNLTTLFKNELKSWPIYISEKPVKSDHKNVLYIGDAFYTFFPTLAQGASQSIEAANEIFELIINNKSELQNKYFKNRLKRTNLINKRSNINYFSFHISNSFLKTLRNKFLKYLLKNNSFVQNYLGKIYK